MRFKKIIFGVLAIFFAAMSMCYAQQLSPDDLVYEGAFRLPDEYNDSHQWEYGGSALAFRPDGDPGGEGDGYTGSLFSVGKRLGGTYLRDVSEFSIPKPVISSSVSNMNTATTKQTFNDLTGGKFDQVLSGQELNEVVGLTYLEAQSGQDSPKMYWSFWSAYNTADVNLASQGYSNLTISNPSAQGAWKVSGYTSKYLSGYLFDIPRDWADTYIGGKYLATGISRAGGAFSRGPVLFAIAPYKYNNSNPPSNSELPTIPLIFYNTDHDNYPDYAERDDWGGGAWITAGSKEAVIFVGLKCLGSTCYGTGDYCGDSCSTSKGYHCYPRQPQMVFYDVNDLTAVALGNKNPWDPQPYSVVNLADIIPQYGGCTQTRGVAYDRQNGRLFLLQYAGDGSKPLIHVFKITGTSDASSPAQLTITSSGTLQEATVNADYQVSLSAYGGVSPLTWELESGSLPQGLNFSSSGIISGTPLIAETETFQIRVTDSSSPAASISKSFTITVNESPALSIGNESPALSIETVSLSNPVVNESYSEILSASGGVSPYSWSLASGSLPGGLALSSAGVISGTPTAVGTYSFTVKVSDDYAAVETKQMTLSVADTPTDMIGFWPLDEGSGSVAMDSTSGKNDLSLTGAVEWVAGQFGKALGLDGQSAYAYRADASLSGAFPAKSSDAATDFTLAAWIYLNTTGARHPIISKQGNSIRGFLFFVEDSDKLAIQVFNKSGTKTEVFSSSSLSAGQWYHVTAAYDFVGDGNSIIKLYIDGNEEGSTSAAIGPVSSNSEPFELGRYYWDSSYSRIMDGRIDDVRVYDRSLSVSEIKALMDGGDVPQVIPSAPSNLHIIN